MTDLDTMARTGCFASVHVSRPSLRTTISWKDLGLPELDDAVVTPPSTRPPSKTYNEFSRLESRMRNCLRAHSAGSAGGFRFIKFGQLGKFLEEVHPLKEAYDAAVDPFLALYDQAVADALAVWEDKANKVYDSLKSPSVDRVTFCRRLVGKLRRAWPESSTLRDRFSAEVQVLQFSLPSEDVLETNTDLIQQARRQAQSTLDGFFLEAQNELRARAIDSVRRMHKVLVKGETITERSIKPLKEFVAQFQQLSVVDDSEFRARLDGIVNALDSKGGAEGLRNDPEAWEEVRGLLDDVAAEGERLVEEATAQKLSLTRKLSV